MVELISARSVSGPLGSTRTELQILRERDVARGGATLVLPGNERLAVASLVIAGATEREQDRVGTGVYELGDLSATRSLAPRALLPAIVRPCLRTSDLLLSLVSLIRPLSPG